MRASFVISVDLDPVAVEREGKRAGFTTLDRTIAAIVSDCENRMVDSIRFRDGVVRVGSDVKIGIDAMTVSR
jgi:hypothetical protein